jgi:hypothetical protein
MNEHPIIFSTPMVQALLDGRKTQTRRIIKLRDGSLPDDCDIPAHEKDTLIDYVMDFSKTFPQWQQLDCPYGKAGDRLWVRESYHLAGSLFYKADGEPDRETLDLYPKWKWRPSIFMPRCFSRIALEIVNIWVERIQDINYFEIMLEGAPLSNYPHHNNSSSDALFEWWISLWNSINEKRGYGWEENLYVWTIEFKKLVT